MLVREVMTSPAVTVRRNASVKEAIELLERHSITAMPVVDQSDRLLGIVSEADLIREMVVPDQRASELPVRSPGPALRARVADVMSNHALTVTGDTDLAKAAELMTSTVVKSLPVVDGEAVVGVISRRDIIRVLSRQDQRIEAEVDELLRQAGQDWLVDVVDGIACVEGPADEKQRELARVLACTVPGVVGVRFASSRRPER
jgi:CBS domain-containing protein